MKTDCYVANVDTTHLNSIHDLLNTNPHSQNTVNHVTNELVILFSNAANITLPQRPTHAHTNINKTDRPWFGPKCKQARKKYHKAKSVYRKKPNLCNRKSLNKASKSYKVTMNSYISKYKHNNANKLRSLNEKQPKKYWNFLKKLKPKNKNTDSPSIDEMYHHFKNINNDENQNKFDEEIEINRMNEPNNYLNSPIEEYEINKCITNLKNGKTPSPNDGILNEYIKNTKHLLMPIYVKLFNCVLNTGILPDSWLEGTIIPIFKNKGDHKDPSNFRPITI